MSNPGADYDREVDPLWKGLCRPPMVWGVPYLVCAFNLLINVLAFIWTSSFIYFLVLPVLLHFAGYLLCMHDAYMFEVIRVKLERTPPVRNRWLTWHCNSYSP